jgi:HEPN domain-containing protein
MRNAAEDEGKRWLAQARADVEAAVHLVAGGHFNVACFLAQQAAEKALKGYLFYRGAAEVWGHSAAELCEKCAEMEPAFRELVKAVSLLDKYYIPTRYPNGLPGGLPKDAFDRLEAERALDIARRAADAAGALMA